MAKYSEKKADLICELVASGDYKIVDLCKKAGISHETYYAWKKSKPEFSESLKRSEEQRLEVFKNMARSGLAKLLDVYEYEEIHTEYVDDPKNAGKPKIKSKKIITKKIMPNPTAVIFALTNLDPANFKHLQHIDHTSKGEKVSPIDYSKLSDSALKEIINAQPEQK